MTVSPTPFDGYILTFEKTSSFQSLEESGLNARDCTIRCAAKNADHPSRLLRACCGGPRRGTGDNRDEISSFHSITSSARASSDGGIARPSVLAVLRLIKNSNLALCWIGRSAGLAPSRILPA